MKFLIILPFLFFIIIFNYVRADVYTSVQDGNWSDEDTWDQGDVPGNNDDVIINHDVTLDTDMTTKTSITINEDASLTGAAADMRIQNNISLSVTGTLEVNGLQFDNGSHINIESSGSVQVNGDFDNRNNSDDVVIDANFNVEGNFNNGEGGVITGTGTISVKLEYTGAGITFGREPTDDIPDGSTIRGEEELPITLVSFTAVLQDDIVQINWVTATEENNEFFTLERSTTGIDFIEIAQINGAGNSSEILHYSFTDSEIPEGTIYYILKQTDYDGNFEYSDIIAVSNEKLQSECKLNVNPNPCMSRCSIIITDCASEEYNNVKFSVFDAMGNTVYTSMPETVRQGTASFTFDVNNNLKPAVYIVRGTGSITKMDEKVIIQK